jgi:hypothetical protein
LDRILGADQQDLAGSERDRMILTTDGLRIKTPLETLAETLNKTLEVQPTILTFILTLDYFKNLEVDNRIDIIG